MPIIFASSILSIPSTIEMFLGERAQDGFWGSFFNALSPQRAGFTASCISC